MQQKQWSSMMLLALYVILIGALLVLVVSGARLYGEIIGVNTEHVDQRSALAFIQNQAAANEGGIEIKPGIEGEMLCLIEAGGKYETRIYQCGGALCTQLCSVQAELNAGSGQRICEISGFALCWEREGLLRVEADGACAYVYCAGGGADA